MENELLRYAVNTTLDLVQDVFAHARAASEDGDFETALNWMQIGAARVDALEVVIEDSAEVTALVNGFSEMEASEIGSWIRNRREEIGWTQENLGEAVGLQNTTISQIENAKGKVARDTVERVARFLRDREKAQAA